MMRIGVIIPTLQEEAVIGQTLRGLFARGDPATVVVADCGSRDRTTAISQQFESVITISDAAFDSRASAMNAGAARAQRECPDLDVLWFLHADSTPPGRWDEAITAALAEEQVVGGAFDIRWDYSGIDWFRRAKLRVFQAINRMRFRITRIFFGDQGIFVRVGAFDEVGGMPEVSLLEDVILCRQLKKCGRLALAPELMRTNPRRFLRHGVCRQVMLDVWLLTAERLGYNPTRLQTWYNRERA